jgi:hypothetical protein
MEVVTTHRRETLTVITPMATEKDLADLFHKIATAPNGSVHRQFVRCGRTGCRCQRGSKHVAYYFHVRANGNQRKYYVPEPFAPLAQALCAERRRRQVEARAELRHAQTTWRRLTDQVRDLGG